MPYTKLSELPDSVKASLPEHAQEIYHAAHLQQTYRNISKRRSAVSRFFNMVTLQLFNFPRT